MAEVFAPGDFIHEELKARGWTQGTLARIIGRPPRVVSELVNRKRALTTQTAIELGAAFGTRPEYWLQLEMLYRLSLASTQNVTAIVRRAIEEGHDRDG